MIEICVVTGTRAEFGLLESVVRAIKNHPQLQLRIIATGMHLSNEFGMTSKEIVDGGYVIDDQVEMLLSSDSAGAVAKSVGIGVVGFSDALRRMAPDAILVLGDRYEILSAVTAAMIMCIPIVHLYGGELTEGAFDESIRHAITKMSYLHFTSTETYRKRVIQLGENPNRVFNVGALAVDNLLNTKLMKKEALELEIPFVIGARTILFTYHPTTLARENTCSQFKKVLEALSSIENLSVIFTKANADTDGRIINEMIDRYVEQHKDNTVVYTSMGRLRYHSAMCYVGAVVGNSSSGILEAPIMKVPTVNIGDRQKGRIRCDSIVDSRCEMNDIVKNIELVLSEEFRMGIESVLTPYGDGGSATRMVEEIVKVFSDETIEITKKFYDINYEI